MRAGKSLGDATNGDIAMVRTALRTALESLDRAEATADPDRRGELLEQALRYVGAVVTVREEG